MLGLVASVSAHRFVSWINLHEIDQCHVMTHNNELRIQRIRPAESHGEGELGMKTIRLFPNPQDYQFVPCCVLL
jgi:hypothetical protein